MDALANELLINALADCVEKEEEYHQALKARGPSAF